MTSIDRIKENANVAKQTIQDLKSEVRMVENIFLYFT